MFKRKKPGIGIYLGSGNSILLFSILSYAWFIYYKIVQVTVFFSGAAPPGLNVYSDGFYKDAALELLWFRVALLLKSNTFDNICLIV